MIKKSLIATVLGITMALIINIFYGVVRVDGISMEPTLNNGRYYLMQKKVNNYKINDLIVADIITVNNGKRTKIVKRIVALEGQTIEIKNGILYRDNVAITEEYLKEKMPKYENYSKFKIPVGEVFVLGDNRNHSIDSREQGTIKISDIKGKILK